VDVVVVREDLPPSWLRQRLGRLEPPPGVKVAVSAFTTREFTEARVPPRLLHALRELGTTGAGVLHRREGFAVPMISAGADDRASRAELPLVVMVLRRLVAAPRINVRAVYKHVVLIMKIVLRADGIAADASDDVIGAFRAGHPSAGVHLPTLAAVGTDWQVDERLTSAVVDAAAAVLAYHDTLGAAVRPGHTAREKAV
jgi:hypothetical protein